MSMNTNSQVHGYFEMKVFKHGTDELVDHYYEHNVITNEGLSLLWRRFVDLDNSDRTLYTFFLGDDYGNPTQYSLLDPEPENTSLTKDDQSIVYRVEEDDMVVSYPSASSIQFSTLLDGDVILDTYFPGLVDMRYCSATMRFRDLTTFSYKRFPVRSLSRLIDIQVIWTYEFFESKDYVCPS